MKRASFAFILLFCLNACNQTAENQTKEETSISGSPAVARVESASEPAGSAASDRDPQNEGAVSDNPVAANKLITPGKSMGLIKLNEQAEVVTKLLGKPTKGNAAMGKSLQTWFSKFQPQGPDTATYQVAIFFSRNMGSADQTSRAQQIRVTSPFFRTADGIGPGTKYAVILNSYPDLKKAAVYATTKNEQEIAIYQAKEAGIAFEINKAGVCIGVAIFEPGKQAFEIYSEVGVNFTSFNS